MSFHLIEDTRQKLGKHSLKNEYWQRNGNRVIRCQLPFGDYVRLPKRAVDTKADIYEIAGNLIHDHERFRNECINAYQCECELVILIENTDGVTSVKDLEQWTESRLHFAARGGRSRFIGSRLAKIMRTMSKRYGVRWEFCTPNESGRRVIELLDE